MTQLNVSAEVNLVDKFSASAAKIAGVSEKLAGRLHEGQKKLRALGRKGQAIAHLKALSARLGKTAAEMDRAKQRTAQLGRELAATTKPTKQLQRQFEAARKHADNLKRQHQQQRDELKRLRGELRGAGIDTRNLGEAQRKIASNMAAATRKMEGMAKQADKVAAARANYDRTLQQAANISLVAGGVHRLGQGALSMVAEPIAQMRTVARSRGELASLGMDKSGVDQIAARGRELSTQLAGVTTAAFVSAAYDIKSGIASLDDAGVADMTAMAALTAKATKAEVGQMTSFFATSYGSFKDSLYETISNRDFGNILSASLAKSVQQFKTDGAKMQQAIQSMGSGLAESGISLAEQFTALGMLQQKMEAGVAGTTMKALERSAAQAQARFEKMGMSIETLDENGNLRSLPALIAEMQAAFGKDYTSETGAIIQEAFGTAEAVEFFKALWGQQDAFRENTQALAEAQQQGTAFTQTMASAMDANMDARLHILEQRFAVIKERLGSALIPALERLMPWLEKAAGWISRLVDNNSRLTRFFMAAVAGVGLIATVIAPVITAVAALTTTLAYLGYAARKSAAETALASAVMGGGKGRGLRGMAGKAGGMLKGKLGLVGAGIGTLAIGTTLMDDTLSGGEKAAQISREAGGIGGALAGAAAGAALGSIVPVVGTAIGGIAGGIIGGMSGNALADGLVGLFSSDDGAKRTPDTSATTLASAALMGTALAAAPVAAQSDEAALPASLPVITAAQAPPSTQHTDNSTHSYHITVTPSPGMDEQRLTELVVEKLKAANQATARRARARQHD